MKIPEHADLDNSLSPATNTQAGFFPMVGIRIKLPGEPTETVDENTIDGAEISHARKRGTRKVGENE
ncbi:MAG TPA: hypothetical protein DD471_00080 [Planctomycetes bacterium]|nr:hypothetical protein [Planctomycetota bacterium]